MNIINLMRDFPIGEDCDGLYGFYLVRCSGFSESGYEVCDVINNKFVSQANGEEINDWVTHCMELNR